MENYFSCFKILFFCILLYIIGFVTGQDQPGAKWMPSQHHTKGRNGKQVKWLIIHGTAGGSSAEGVGRWFQDNRAQASTHYIVGQDGTIVQSVREADSAWANGGVEDGADSWWRSTGNPNYVTISIEHVKSKTDNSNVLTDAQKSASFTLVRDIIKRNPAIRKAWANGNGGITGHYSMQPQSRERCPGPYPWDDLYSFLGGNSGKDDGECTGTVTAKDGLRIRSQPNTSSSVVGSLSNGQKVKLTGRTSGENIDGNKNWFNVPNGYVSGRYLAVSNKGGPSWCNN